MHIPAGLVAGAYRLVACADAANVVREANERDNCRLSGRSVALSAGSNPPPPPPPPPSPPPPPPPPAPCAAVKVNELVTGTTLSPGEEWIELYNACTSTVDASGWTIVYRDAANNAGGPETILATLPSSTFIPAGGYLLAAGAGYIGLATADIALSPGLAASGGAVGVRNASKLLDSVAYGMLTAPNDLREGAAASAPATLPTPGQSIGRVPNGADTNVNSFDFRVSTLPTPRAANA